MATNPGSIGKAGGVPGLAGAAGQAAAPNATSVSGSTGDPKSAAAAAETADPPKKPLTPEAQRALTEAEERRRLLDQQQAADGTAPKELGGRKGPDPARYGDWENGGIASDF